MKSIEVKDSRPDRTLPLPSYESFKPILDRVMIKRIVLEKVPDGFVVPEKYRQHTNVGEVVAIGDFVVLGGQVIPLSNFIKVGDKVWWGEYNSEKFEFDNVEYALTRIQDIRGIERLIVPAGDATNV